MSSSDFFVMCKPDCCTRGLIGKIVSRFEKKGFKLVKAKYLDGKLIENIIRTHYQQHLGKSFYENLINFSTSGFIFAMIWNGNIQVARQMIGATLPWEATPGTIRGDYSCTLPANLVHCSDSFESANVEVKLWNNILD